MQSSPVFSCLKKMLIILIIYLSIFSCKKEKDKEIKYLTFIKAGQTGESGIKYINFEPPKELFYPPNEYYTKSLFLDLNNDSIDDFELKYEERAAMSCCFYRRSSITPLGNNSVCVSKIIPEGSMGTYVQSLAEGDTIGSKNNWLNSKAYLFSFWSATHTDINGQQFTQISIDGEWYEHDNIYLGVKIVMNDKDYFGWIDVKMGGEAVRSCAITFPYEN